MYKQSEILELKNRYPILNQITELNPVCWINPKLKNVQDGVFPVNREDIEEAEQLWDRFRPFLKKEFPETRDGMIESSLKDISKMKTELESRYSYSIEGNLFLKCDNELPVAGSVKARGGFFEVLHYAEILAKEAGLLREGENYEVFSSSAFKDFFSNYSIGVGSTGNLGLSIGIMSAKLGFQVSVYMSSDAKQWKKELLREKGARVVEIAGDFSNAISNGREKTKADPNGYFVDDENSKELFLGYSTAALRLKNQLDEKKVKVDKEHPLFVYLPCGVGGAPGGITFGLKQIFGNHVHCFFVEPVHSPSSLIGLVTGRKEKVSVQDFGIDNRTEADGLAVGRTSKFAGSISEQLVSGIFTVTDDSLYQWLRMLVDSEGIFVEPSATVGFSGPIQLIQSDYIINNQLKTENSTHIVWATGGGLVPEKEMREFLKN